MSIKVPGLLFLVETQFVNDGVSESQSATVLINMQDMKTGPDLKTGP